MIKEEFCDKETCRLLKMAGFPQEPSNTTESVYCRMIDADEKWKIRSYKEIAAEKDEYELMVKPTLMIAFRWAIANLGIYPQITWGVKGWSFSLIEMAENRKVLYVSSILNHKPVKTYESAVISALKKSLQISMGINEA